LGDVKMDVIIGKQVHKPTKKNRWEVELRCMSGDADAYHTNGGIFVEKQKMLNYVTIATAISEAMKDGYARTQREVEAEIEKVLSPELFKEVKETDHIWDMCGSDVTSEEYLASLEDIDVFWYDETGIKFECVITS